MYNKLYKFLEKYSTYLSTSLFMTKRIFTEELYIEVAYIKYICENNIGDITFLNINNDNFKEKISELVNYKRFAFINVPLDIEKVFKITKNVSSYELIENMLKENKNNLGINIIDKNEKKLCVLKDLSINAYDRYGNTVYLYPRTIAKYRFTMLDEILNVKNEYIPSLDSIDYSIGKDIKYVYISTEFKKEKIYDLHSMTDISEITKRYLKLGKTVIVRTIYRNISSITGFYSLIDKVIISNDSDQAMAFFNQEKNWKMNDAGMISLILYDKDKISNIEKLKKVLVENRENPKYLIKIKLRDFRMNNNRIGFKLYSTEKNMKKAKTINELVDANTKIIRKLKLLDNTIAAEMDKIISK